jgi:hypothetical protein
MVHIVRAYLMSQESEKFPLGFIPLRFVDLINMISSGRDWGKETQTPSACPRPYEQQYAEDSPPNGVGFALFILNGIRLRLWREGSQLRPPESRSIGGDLY